VSGAVLGLVFGATAGLRRSKPLHPVGVVANGILDVEPEGPASGVPLLDEAGRHECRVRASYAVGTGPEHPDIEGFALRVLLPSRGVAADVLFASTGDGPLTRFGLTVRPRRRHAVQTTLIPIRVDGRPLVLRLEPLDRTTQPWPSTYSLSWAHGTGTWRRWGALAVDWVGDADVPERFDPIRNPIPGTSQYLAVRLLREPSYRLSRVARPSAGRLAPTDGVVRQ